MTLLPPRALLLGLALTAIGCAGSRTEGAVPAEGTAATKAPRRAVDFALRDLKGQKVSLSRYHDKVVLVSFWATWCEPCRTELSVLQETWDRLRDKGFELVTVCVDPADSESAVREQARRYAYRFPVLLDSETRVVNRFNPTMDLPFSILVDRAGSVRAIHQGYQLGDESLLEKEILEALAR